MYAYLLLQTLKMDFRLFGIITTISVLLFSTVRSACVNPKTETDLDSIVPIYKCFVDGVFETISEIGENNSATITEADLGGGSVASLIGIAYILAGVKDQAWTISYPLFASLMDKLYSEDLLRILGAVAQEKNQIYLLNTVMFLPPGGQAYLEQDYPIEVLTADFEEDDVTIPFINDKITNLTFGAFQTSYIEDGVLIPSATLSILVNVFQTNLAWSLPWESIGPKEFNGKEYGEVIQVTGELHYAQGSGETELFLFFEDNAGGIAFRMPKDITVDRSVANLETMAAVEASTATAQFPILNYILRSNYEMPSDNDTMCSFKGPANMLELLDVLSHVRLDVDSFSLISVSGAQVVNVEQFAEELRQQNVTREDDQGRLNTKMDAASSEVEDVEYSEGHSPDVSSAEQVEAKDTEDPHVVDEAAAQVILKFNRPFTWLLFDRYKVPIAAGVVTSLHPPEPVAPIAYSFLGMEGSWNPYLNCV